MNPPVAALLALIEWARALDVDGYVFVVEVHDRPWTIAITHGDALPEQPAVTA